MKNISLNDRLYRLEGGENYEYISPKTGNHYHFFKDEDFHNQNAFNERFKDIGLTEYEREKAWDECSNMVDLTVTDKDGKVLGDYFGLHLEYYDFYEDTIDEDYLTFDRSLPDEDYER